MGSVAPSFDPSSIKIEDRLFINGEFVPSKAGKKFDVFNPATEKLAASVYEALPEDVDAAVAAAKAAFPAWSELGAVERASYIEKLAAKVQEHLPEFSYLDAITMGKPVHNDMFSYIAIPAMKYFAGRALEVTGDSSLNTAGMVNISLRQPFGVCGAIVSLHPPTHSSENI
jgi:aldehyde dehydrogenase (NAD+)